jgi:hypothetical protein
LERRNFSVNEKYGGPCGSSRLINSGCPLCFLFGYSEEARRECAASHERTGRVIKLLTVQQILDEEHVQKM